MTKNSGNTGCVARGKKALFIPAFGDVDEVLYDRLSDCPETSM